jgi:acetylornithine deacetylase/succinyl-diaminopimelate desuccinylase-like protein
MQNLLGISNNLLDFRQREGDRFVRELIEFLRIPSISALPEHADDVRRAAVVVQNELTKIGLTDVRLIEAPGRYPLVYAELLKPGKPTILIYGHYDVQPIDPLELWTSPPFEPEIRDGNIYARGAADDKGQVWLLLKALETMLTVNGELPVGVKVLIEGEEEAGGEHIEAYVRAHAADLGVDAVLVCDTEMQDGLPAIMTGLRGIVCAEIQCQGADGDLHSGIYGGVAPNAFEGLIHILSKLKGIDGVVNIPGFNECVVPPSGAEFASWRSLPFDHERYLRDEVRAHSLVGDTRYTVYERLWGRPTFEVHGILGGFTGAGAKTVIPAKARAKVSMRLVPGQEPDAIAALFEKQVLALTPPGYTSSVEFVGSARPMLIDPNNFYVTTAAEALSAQFGMQTVLVRCGGSIGIGPVFGESLGVPVVFAGFGLADDQIHAPNEKFNLSNFHNGIEAVIRMLTLFGQRT